MSKRPVRPESTLRNSQLQCLNEKIALLAAHKPWSDIYRSFSAAHLADSAIEAAEELQHMPGTDIDAIQPTLIFWCRLRDYSHVAALAVVGGNQTLAEAITTILFLQGFASEVPSVG